MINAHMYVSTRRTSARPHLRLSGRLRALQRHYLNVEDAKAALLFLYPLADTSFRDLTATYHDSLR